MYTKFNADSEVCMINITDRAKEKIQELLDQNKGKYLRMYVQGIGWGGPRLGLVLDEPEENEKPVQANGVDILVEERVNPFVKGATVDYVKNWLGEGFRISRPDSAC